MSNDGPRVIIAGGRDFGARNGANGYFDLGWHRHCSWRLYGAMDRLFGEESGDLVILCGMAAGADTLGKAWAEAHGKRVEKYPADWQSHGKAAGFLRNRKMAESADVLVAFWDGQSRGTKHMIDTALAFGLETHVYRYAPQEPQS